MFEGFRILFWGIFLITFHINLGPIALLPVFIGYIVVSRGINHLQQEFDSPYYQKAGNVSLVLTILGVISFLLTWAPQQSLFLSYYPLLFSVLELMLVYYILEGTIEKFVADEEKELAGDYRSEQRTYITIMTIYIIGMCIAITFVAGILSFVMVLIGLFLRLWLMAMLGRLKRAGQKSEEAPIKHVTSNYDDEMEDDLRNMDGNPESTTDDDFSEVVNPEEDQTDPPYEP